jgi:hypothetical protein
MWVRDTECGLGGGRLLVFDSAAMNIIEEKALDPCLIPA